MTREEIAEKIYPSRYYDSDSKRKEDEYSLFVINWNKINQKKRDELIQLITTLQKETWDQACKAQRELNFKSGMVEKPELIYAPFNPEI